MDSEASAFGAATNKHHRYMVFGKKQRYIEVFQCSGEDMSVVLTGAGAKQPGQQPPLLSPGMLPPPLHPHPHTDLLQLGQLGQLQQLGHMGQLGQLGIMPQLGQLGVQQLGQLGQLGQDCRSCLRGQLHGGML